MNMIPYDTHLDLGSLLFEGEETSRQIAAKLGIAIRKSSKGWHPTGA
jgi:hypothetical protein